jgi:ketosteroid isomerase-like protein
MRKLALTTAVLLALSAAACSQPATTTETSAAAPAAAPAETAESDMNAALARHVTAVKAGDVEGVMADYADDATLVLMPGDLWPKGALVGKTEVRKFFEWLKGPEILPGAQSMVVTTEKIGPNTMYFHFTQFPGTPQEVKGFDIYTFRDGKIVHQTTFVTDAPK